MNIRPYLDTFPTIGARAYIDPAAILIGDVTIGDDASIWPMCVIRGDVNRIVIGARTNVQDGTIIHVTHDGPFTPGGVPTLIGSDVTVGHGAILHACTIGDFALIGMGARVLDGVTVETFAFVGAGAVVPPGKTVGEGELWLGNPARCVRKLDEAQLAQLRYSAAHYVRLKDRYLSAG